TILGPATLGNVIVQGEFDEVLDRGDSDEIVQRGADGAEQPLTAPAPGAVPVGGIGGVGAGATVPAGVTGAGPGDPAFPGIAPARRPLPPRGGPAGGRGEVAADGAEQPLPAPAPGAVPVGGIGGVGAGATVPAGVTGAGPVDPAFPGIAPARPTFPRMDGSAGEPREIATDETYDLLAHSCEEELESIPLAAEEGKGTSSDGLWSLSGSAELDLSVTCEAKLG